MRNHYFKILLFCLFCTVYPANIRAEMLYLMKTNQDLTIVQKLTKPYRENGDVKERIRSNKTRLHKLFFQKWKGKDERKGGLVFGIIALYFLTFICVVWGLGSIAIAFGLGGGTPAVILGIVALGLGALCIAGIVKLTKKLHRLKHSKTLPEELPRRPPSRNLKHQ